MTHPELEFGVILQRKTYQSQFNGNLCQSAEGVQEMCRVVVTHDNKKYQKIEI